jgi:hypothetical protein
MKWLGRAFLLPGKASMYVKSPIFVVAAALFLNPQTFRAESAAGEAAKASESVAEPIAVAPEPALRPDPCADAELQPNSMSPTWNIQAATVQCGALETDNLAVLQPMGGGVTQWTIATTAKYGLAPRLQLRWGMPGRISQHAAGTRPVTGTTDQAVGLLVHFRDQGAWLPALAIDYGMKIPTANPSKAFGSGFVDHVLTAVASRDTGPYHLDFNLAATLAGAPRGHDHAMQSGLGLSRTFPHSLMGTVEVFGGSQAGTDDRLGAVLLGGSWGIRPWLALNGGTVRTYTAGSPRQQVMAGFIYTVLPGLRVPRLRGR